MAAESKHFEPFVPPEQTPPEFTLAPIVMGTLLGILFGASSVYLVLKVGLTVSASIPVAVLAFALFRTLSGVFGLRKRSVLENNIAQTAGSAGESIAFGVGLVMPALLVLGYDIDVVRVMTVGVLGGLLGILMMIPLRRAFIVQKHGELKYPEGTACAEVLIAGEKGGATAGTLVIGIVVGFVYQFAMLGFKLWKDVASQSLSWVNAATGKVVGLKGAAVSCEMSAPLLGVGFIIGPRIAGIMVAGGVLAYLVISPMIVYFGDSLETVLPPALSKIKDGKETGLIKNMGLKQVRDNYILYIGAGAVAAGGIISMFKALPVILASLGASLRDLRGPRGGTAGGGVPRTDRDLPISVVIFGSLGMILAIALAPQLGLGFSFAGLAGALMILLFGFLFVTVSSRLTGEIGSSSNPISGMTVATLLMTCSFLLLLNEAGVIELGKSTKLLALTIAGVVCVACSNGGTTSQALKTGYLLGATPKYQQYTILIGSLVSALCVGVVLIMLNQASTIYTKRDLPKAVIQIEKLKATDTVHSGQYADDKTEYKVLILGDREPLSSDLLRSGVPADVPPGRYLIAADGSFAYRCDPAVNGKLVYEDRDTEKPEEERKKVNKFDAPKTQLVAMIIDGILDRNLPWDLVIIGVLIAVTLELAAIPSLPFAVGVYLPLSSSMPIFLGGLLRGLVDKLRRRPEEGDSSPGVLLASGYIAGGSIAALIAAFMAFDTALVDRLDYGQMYTDEGVKVVGVPFNASNLTVSAAFLALMVILVLIGWLSQRNRREP